MKVLITGAGGFIGSHLVDDQLTRGREVLAVDIKEGNLAAFKGRPGLRVELCDVADSARLASFLPGIDVVFHLAAMHLEVGAPAERFEQVNVRGVRAFLEAARTAGVKRFVHCSSVGIYGDVAKIPSDESGPFNPTNLYETSKLAGERAALAYHKETGFPVVVVRPAWVFGPRCPRTAKMLRAVKKGRFLMIGPGNNLRHPVYISDMIDAFNRAADIPEAVGEAFLIAGPKSITTKEFLTTFAEAAGAARPKIKVPMWVGYLMALAFEAAFALIGKHPPMSRRTLVFFTNNNAFDISKARRLLGFEPKHDLLSGLKETIKAGA